MGIGDRRCALCEQRAQRARILVGREQKQAFEPVARMRDALQVEREPMQSVAMARHGFGRAAEVGADALDDSARIFQRELRLGGMQRRQQLCVLAFDRIDALRLLSKPSMRRARQQRRHGR